ncbi:hypothetical protein BKA69DRAFT_1036711 [Paraphysoderma sedebokerense]|nr:hypothetical protein BKA69DRAFT_1036711 [Paraphysoderma sedebokerense]
MSSFDPFYESSFQTNSQSQYTPLPHALAETATVSNASNRLKKHEMFILAALWMEYSPYCLAPTVYFGRGHERRMNKSGAVLVDKEGRIVALEYVNKKRNTD